MQRSSRLKQQRMIYILLLLMVCGVTVDVTDSLAQTFTDASGLLEIGSFAPGFGFEGAAAVDANNDGWIDFALPGRLYIRQADGTYLNQISVSGLAGLLGRGAWGDFDADGAPDVLAQPGTNPAALLQNGQQGQFTAVSQAAGIPPLRNIEAATWADFDNNGTLDLYLGQSTGENRLFVNIDGLHFFDIGMLSGLGATRPSCAAAASDFDRDGDQDLFVGVCGAPAGTAQGRNLFFRNDGQNRYVDISSQVGLADAPTEGVIWFDYDNDGWQDLYLINRFEANALYRNTGEGTFENVTFTSGALGSSGRSRGYAAADFDNDGWTDLILSNSSPGGWRLLRNVGNGTFSNASSASGLNVQLMEALMVGDFDGDGWVDLMALTDNTDGLYLNDGGTNHWLEVQARGVVTNRGGLGARVEVVAGGVRQVREISAGDAFTSQSHVLTAHFGLGGAGVVDTLEVYWPSGRLDRFEQVSVDQALNVVEGEGINSAPGAFALLAPLDRGRISADDAVVPFQWEAAVDPDGDVVRYTFHANGPGVDLALPGILETHVEIPPTVFNQNEQYSWTVVATDGHSVRRSLDRFHFTVGTIQTFTDASDRLRLSSVSSGFSIQGATSVDVNSDGWTDLYLPGRLYLNRGDAFFEELASEYGVGDEAGNNTRVAWGDYDGDGFLDAYMLNGVLLQNTVITGLEPVSDEADIINDKAPLIATWADFDGDGLLDLYIGKQDREDEIFGVHTLYRNNGDGTFVDVAGQAGLTQPRLGCSAAASDYDQDGDTDLFLGVCFGRDPAQRPNVFYRNDGGGRFTEVGVQLGLSDFPTHAMLWFDYDNDGWQDLYLANSNRPNHLFRNDRAGGFIDVTEAAGVGEPAIGRSLGLAAADFDNDGWTDLFMSLGDGSPHYYRNNRDGTFTEIYRASGIGLTDVGGVTTGDYNNDGWVDLVLVQGTKDHLFLNNTGRNHWLKVKARGASGNAYGIGARVYVFSGGLTQMQEITTGDAMLSQNMDLTAHFGLGESVASVVVEVHWPGGAVERLENVPVDQEITVVEGGGINGPPSGFALNSPGDGDRIGFGETEITFSWEPPANAGAETVEYTLFLQGAEGEVNLSYTGLTEPMLTIDRNEILNNHNYTWIVVASDGYSVRGPRRPFRLGVGEPPVPELLVYPFNLRRAYGGSLDLGDYDGDGDQDLLLTGESENGPISRIYHLYDSTFTVEVGELIFVDSVKAYRDLGPGLLPPVRYGSARWGDVDLDGDLDIALMGLDGQDQPITRVLGNVNALDFQLFYELQGVYGGELAWGDYDDDGDLDLVIAGATELQPPLRPVTLIYRNDRGVFTGIDAGLPGVAMGNVAWGDYDDDGDLDLALTGQADGPRFISSIFRNDGGTFTDIRAGLPGLVHSELAWGDYDGDDDLDLLVSGGALDPSIFRAHTAIYRNDSGVFSDIHADLPDVMLGSVTWADFDGDRDLDILLVGTGVLLGRPSGRVMRNAETNFVPEVLLGGLIYSAVTAGDYNADGDTDFILQGLNESGDPFTTFLMNRQFREKLPPGFVE